MKTLKLLQTFAYGFSASVVFLGLLYAFDVGIVRSLFGPVPNPAGMLVLLGGLSLIFVGVGMLLARMGVKNETL